jgi:ABC-type glycerol-3-phosphate transport system substrate-binding protein
MKWMKWLVLVLVLTISNHALAQNPTALTLAIPEHFADAFDDSLLSAFEVEYSVDVMLVRPGDLAVSAPPAYEDIEAHLARAQAYASLADVLYVEEPSIEQTRAGYLLDLNPLVQSDPDLSSADYYPALWNAYQWDAGLWALPVGGRLTVVLYDPAAFDAAGLTYPDGSWTIDQFAAAARALTVRGGDGNVTPGLFVFNPERFFRTLSGTGLYDPAAVPQALNNPNLTPLLDVWRELEAEGAADWVGGIILAEGYQSPLIIGLAQAALYQTFNQRSVNLALLPGDTSLISTQGFAVSAGTQQPQLAYELVKFLSQQAALAARFGVDVPALRANAPAPSLQAAAPEVQTFFAQAADVALPTSDLRYGSYLWTALSAMQEGGLDALTAQQQAQQAAEGNLQAADAARQTTQAVVAAPTPAPALMAGEIDLRFAVISANATLPTQEFWDQVIEDFTARDAQIGNLTFEVITTPQADIDERFDCYYSPRPLFPFDNNFNNLSLDPFMAADANFDTRDFLPGVLTQTTYDGRVWGFPLNLQPELLIYNRDQFTNASLAEPFNGWTLSEFTATLGALEAVNGEFALTGMDFNKMLMLIAAYGGLPIDTRVSPPTVNLTDAATVNAIQQVLDLVRGGLIYHASQGELPDLMSSEPPFYNFEGWSFIPFYEFSAYMPYRLVSYPVGEQYQPISYVVGAAYISANSLNADACYRWISTLSAHPELFGTLPARRSALSSSAYVTQQGEEGAAFYQSYAALFDQPNVVIFPGDELLPEMQFVRVWIERAFERYLTGEADLAPTLDEAQRNWNDYVSCIAAVSAPVWDDHQNCASSVTP